MPSAVPVATPAKPSISGVADAVRTLKLVTWQFDTTISADSVSDKWYGNAVASVRAPVRYQYGVDLKTLQHEDVLFDANGDYTFLVAPPQRIAAEVNLAELQQSLETSGVRWRSNNQGELETARKQLAARAQTLELSPEDNARLRDASREQLEHLLRDAIGNAAAKIRVRFVD